MPASASPASTLVSTPLTSCSKLSTSGVSPAALNTLSAAAPQGTATAHTAIFSEDLPKSASPVTLPGLLDGTTISNRLRTNSCGLPAASPASVTVFMVAGDAAANTSAGALATICWANVDEPPKENVTCTPGFWDWKAVASFWNTSVSEAAASTVRSPVTGPMDALGDGDAEADAVSTGAVLLLVVSAAQAVIMASATALTLNSASRLWRAIRGCMVLLLGGGRTGERDQPGSGISMTTFVDFTEASARTPGSSPSSSAASRLINDTMRWGPACISTCAITLSRITLVTMPRSRLRADAATT